MVQKHNARHLIDSQDWSLDDINRLWHLTRCLRDGETLPDLDDCLKRKTVILWFNAPSTRTRLTLHQAVVEMGGVPLYVGMEDFHDPKIEDLADLARAMALSASAICLRLLPTKNIPYGQGEAVLRRIAEEAEKLARVPVISLSHDRCHPCQGLYEMLTIQNALKRNELAGTRILFTWVRGQKARPWSSTQDSLLIATRLGMRVTLCHPPEFGLDPEIIDRCQRNATNSGGSFDHTDDFSRAFHGQEVVYARHWANQEQQVCGRYNNWYCDQTCLGKALFLHPMPLARGDEVSAEVADGSQSLLQELLHNKYYLQKALLAMVAGCWSRGGDVS
ncbi:MAG: hypothetical protein WC614_13020 [bacterium]